MTIIEKNVLNTIGTIESLFSENFYEVTSAFRTLTKTVAKTQYKEDGLFFEFVKMEPTSRTERHQIMFSNSIPLKFANYARAINFNLNDSKYNFSVGFSGYTKVSGYLREFTTNYLDEFPRSYYRAVIIRNSDHALSGFFNHNNSLKIGDSTYGSGVLEITIKDVNLHLFTYTSEETKKSYFIIESQNETSYSEFISIQDELILSIIYLTGCFLGKNIYILGSKDKYFETDYILALKHFFDDLKDGHAAIPNVMLQHEAKVPVKRFPVNSLENLIHKILDSLVYKRAILLICQAHTEPPYVTSTLYSVALETITNEIFEEIKNKIIPINNKEIAKKLRNSLKKVLVEYKSLLTEDAFTKISYDLDRINSPTNKQKLLAPFTHFGITLPSKDMVAIEKRNDFLHGRIPEVDNNHSLSLTNGRLLFCINCLVLKHVGFAGYVTYTPTIYQFNNNIEVDDNLIREI